MTKSKRGRYQSMKSHTQRGWGGEGGGPCACTCALNVHVRARWKEVKRLITTCIHVLNGRRLTVPLKEIPGSSILKLFNVVAIYSSKFLPVNIEQCSLLGLSCVSVDSTMLS